MRKRKLIVIIIISVLVVYVAKNSVAIMYGVSDPNLSPVLVITDKSQYSMGEDVSIIMINYGILPISNGGRIMIIDSDEVCASCPAYPASINYMLPLMPHSYTWNTSYHDRTFSSADADMYVVKTKNAQSYYFEIIE